MGAKKDADDRFFSTNVHSSVCEFLSVVEYDICLERLRVRYSEATRLVVI